MRALLALLLLGAAASPALAEDSFDAKAAGAVRVKRIDDIVWVLTATCDQGGDTQMRQCRRLRDARVAALGSATLLVEADRDALAVGAWSAQKKSSPVTLSSCIRCSGVELDGKTWYIVANKDGNATPRFEGGKLKVGPLHDNAKAFADDASAKKFAATAATAKVELLVKVPAKPKWAIDGKQGIALDVLGYRVVSPCDGSVIVANPPSAGGEVDRKACATNRAAVDALTPTDIKDAMKPVLAAAKDCYSRYKLGGKGKLKLEIAADGSVASYEQQGDFVGNETGACIDTAVKAAAFPPSKKPKTTISVPVALP